MINIISTDDIATGQLSLLRVSTEWVALEIISEADVFLTSRGFIPVLRVKLDNKKTPRLLSISAKSLAYPLDEMRNDNSGYFTGLKFELRKAGSEKTALFQLR